MYAAANDILGNIVKVTPSSKVVGDLALHLVGGRRRPGRVRRGPGLVRHPRLGDRLPQRRARRPARRLAGAVPHQGARGPHLEAAGRRADRRAARGARRGTRGARSTSCCSPGRPGSSRSRARRTATCRCCRRWTTSTGCARARSTRSRSTRARRLILGLQAISDPDERGFRTVMATINGQLRPISIRDRSVVLGGRRGREGRRLPARPGRRAVPGRGDGRGRGGRPGRGRRHRRHHRGDEDGGLDHRARSPAPSSGSRIAGPQSVEGGDLVLVLA